MAFLDGHGNVLPEFAETMVKLAACYPSARLEEATVRMYAAALGDLTLKDVKVAFGRAVRECKFFPTVAELRGQVVTPEADAGLRAWTGLQRAAVDAGAWRSLETEDGAVALAVEEVFGSWPQYCQASDVAVAAKKAEFLAAHRAARRLPGVLGPRRLAGLLGAQADGTSGRLLAAGRVELAAAPANRLTEGDDVKA